MEGLRVSVTLTVQPNEAELRAMSPFLDERRATARRAAAVVRNLIEGKLPPAVEPTTYITPTASGTDPSTPDL